MNNMGIKKAYRQALITQGFNSDPAQEKVVATLDEIQVALLKKHRTTSNIFYRYISIFTQNNPAVCGLYLWGDVGRGKTWIVNLFIDSLPAVKTKRLHFHHFMIDIHKRLATLTQQKNPLEVIAKHYSNKYQVLCLDEFIVTNITDAMLLNGLLDALFRQGITLIATSNRIPEDLYKNGLQRERFLPAIDLIKKHTRVVHLDGDMDHRLALLEAADIYLSPVTQSTHQYLLKNFEALATDTIKTNKILTINKRPIKAEYHSDEVAWFSFNTLCDAPRATPDYIELAKLFHTIFITDVPEMDEYLDDKARRFIYLIDEMYDRSVKVVISAELPAGSLYTGRLLQFAFNRTASRLTEMRSEAYLSRSHQLESRHRTS